MITISEIIMIAAISPGIIVFTGSRVGLNITRTRASTPGAAIAIPDSARCWALKPATIWEA